MVLIALPAVAANRNQVQNQGQTVHHLMGALAVTVQTISRRMKAGLVQRSKDSNPALHMDTTRQ
jgi:hypothetical protein